METESVVIAPTGNLGHIAGKYLTFSLADEQYGLEILKVREIIGMMHITAVPRTPAHVKGVINLRGKIVPVIDLRLKFGMPEAERTEQTCIVVVQVDENETGIIVDHVSEVLDIAAEHIQDTPTFGTNVDTRFILGMAKIDQSVKILLDADRIVSASDTAAVTEISFGDDEPDGAADAG